MSDYSTAAASAQEALEDSTDGGFIEEYRIGSNFRQVRHALPLDQLRAATMLEGLAARRSRGIFTLARMKNPQ